MFRRIIETKYKDKVYQYLKLVESYRDVKGRLRQRVVLNPGNVEELKGGKLDEVIEQLRKYSKWDKPSEKGE